MVNHRVAEIPKEYRPQITDLPGDLARIASVIEEHRPGEGVSLTLFLAQVFRGQNLYLRNVDYLVNQIRDDAIRAEYDQGGKVKALALRWRLSTRWVEDILARPSVPSLGKKPAKERQIQLF